MTPHTHSALVASYCNTCHQYFGNRWETAAFETVRRYTGDGKQAAAILSELLPVLRAGLADEIQTKSDQTWAAAVGAGDEPTFNRARGQRDAAQIVRGTT